MDIIKFRNPTHPLKMEGGSVVNNLKSITWVERYAQAGEFTLVARANSGMRDILPIGSFISQIDSSEIMVVENHEVKDVPDRDSDIVITGRGLETIFESRVVGSNKVLPSSGETMEYILVENALWEQIITLMKAHILASELIDDGNALPYIAFWNSGLVGIPEGHVARSIKRAPLYNAVLELLAVENLGIKVYRPGFLGFGDLTYTTIAVHKGVDRSKQLILAQDTGEIVSSEYLWSNKKQRNAILVSGRWVETAVVPAETETFRRWTTLDAADIDNNLEAAPVGAALDAIVASMQQRGREALARLNDIALQKVEVSKESQKARFRVDFDVGDIVSVSGAFNESTVMRITEYVEIEDETGSSRYPTLDSVQAT